LRAVGFGVRHHRAEFENLKLFAAKADTPLAIEERTVAVELDGDRGEDEQRRHKHDQPKAEENVEKAFNSGGLRRIHQPGGGLNISR
jgi:hypothetical protein